MQPSYWFPPTSLSILIYFLASVLEILSTPFTAYGRGGSSMPSVTLSNFYSRPWHGQDSWWVVHWWFGVQSQSTLGSIDRTKRKLSHLSWKIIEIPLFLVLFQRPWNFHTNIVSWGTDWMKLHYRVFSLQNPRTAPQLRQETGKKDFSFCLWNCHKIECKVFSFVRLDG